MKTYTFWNVSISVTSTNGKRAYTKLCNALDKAGLDFVTDVYTTEDQREERPTSDLFPKRKRH